MDEAVLCPLHPGSPPFALLPRKAEGDGELATRLGGEDEVARREVTVCPECGFASAEPRLFAPGDGVAHRPLVLGEAARAAVVAGRDARMRAAATASPALRREGRPPRDELVALGLAVASASAVACHDRELGALMSWHQGWYHVRLAAVSRALGLDAAVAGHLRRAGAVLDGTSHPNAAALRTALERELGS